MSEAPEVHGPYLNTDRELWRERPGDYYADSLHVTEGGGIGMNVGGFVIVKPIREWHALARVAAGAGDPQSTSGAGDRPPAPSEVVKLAFLKAVSRIEEGLVLHDLWEKGLDAGLAAAYAVDFGAVRPPPRAASEENPE